MNAISTIARAWQFLIPVAAAGTLVLACGPAPTSPPAPSPSVNASSGPDLGRYCQLSDQVSALENQYPNNPEAVLGAARAQLTELPRVAPVEIRDAVNISVTDIRAQADEPGVKAPDASALEQAEKTIDMFEEKNCP
jgi:hypothetical protein